jgi:RNA recognition motif-containing protein
VRKSLGKKKDQEGKARSAGKTGSTVSRESLLKKAKARLQRRNDRKMDMSDERAPAKKSDQKGFSRKVVIKKGPNAPADTRRKVKITNVPFDLTWKDVKNALSGVGNIERCDVGHGEAVLTFGNHKEAERAIQTYNGGDMNGRKIRVFFV